MRRASTRPVRLRPHHRLGGWLALAALLLQLLLPAAAAMAMGVDPLASAPICTAASHSDSQHQVPHKALHAACPLCQGQTVVWGFVPPDTAGPTGPHRLVRIVWQSETRTGAPTAVAGLRARGPPAAA